MPKNSFLVYIRTYYNISCVFTSTLATPSVLVDPIITFFFKKWKLKPEIMGDNIVKDRLEVMSDSRFGFPLLRMLISSEFEIEKNL